MNLVRHLALIMCTMLPFAASAFDDIRPPPDRAHSLLNSFEVMCNLNTPNFEHLSAQATAMRMKVLGDTSETTPAGETVQRKGWVGMLTTGPFALHIEKMSGSKGVATSCAIEGPVPNMDEFREIVIKTLHLTTPPEQQTIEGSHTYYWDNHSGDGRTVIVRNMERPAGHFVQVKLVSMAKAETH
jgi:hypothetical protein